MQHQVLGAECADPKQDRRWREWSLGRGRGDVQRPGDHRGDSSLPSMTISVVLPGAHLALYPTQASLGHRSAERFDSEKNPGLQRVSVTLFCCVTLGRSLNTLRLHPHL